MNFFSALLVTVLMCAILATGVVLLVAGKPWLMIGSLVVFTFLFIKYGCLAH